MSETSSSPLDEVLSWQRILVIGDLISTEIFNCTSREWSPSNDLPISFRYGGMKEAYSLDSPDPLPTLMTIPTVSFPVGWLLVMIRYLGDGCVVRREWIFHLLSALAVGQPVKLTMFIVSSLFTPETSETQRSIIFLLGFLLFFRFVFGRLRTTRSSFRFALGIHFWVRS
jgi:hypothetical protein